MKRFKQFISAMLSMLLVFCAFPAPGLAASSEIWPGYPGVDQLPAINTIPDPFKFFDVKNDPNGDGYVSNPSEWTARRNEIRDLVQHYWLGYRWPTRPQDVVGEYNKAIEVPNTVSIWGTNINLKSEFDKLVSKLLAGTVTVNQTAFGPASNETEAVQMAVNAWNAGYSVTIKLFGVWDYAVTLKNYTGTITKAPDATTIVRRNVVTITNPDTNTKANFFINITTPAAEQLKLYWGDENAQAPVIIDIGSTLSQAQIAATTQAGYAYISFTPTDIYPDDTSASDGINRDGVYTKLYPYNKNVYEYASGALMAWSWGASQIISALEQITPDGGGTKTWGEELNIDPTKTLVTGHSRYGKAALFAAAFDDRFSICLPSESGGSGIQSYRYKVEGKIFNFNTYPKADRVYGKTEIPTVTYGQGTSWMPETAAQFLNKDNQLPFDADEIIALVAPRPFFATTGIDTHWLGNEGSVASVQAAAEVYDFIGKNEIEKTNIAIRARESNHALYNRDLPFVIAIMDREFKQSGDDKKLHVKDLFPTGSDTLGNISYPAKDYNYVSEFNSYPFDINSSYLPWSSSNKYTLWTAQENFLVGYPVTITAHSNAPDVKLYLPDKKTVINAYSHNGDVFTFKLAKEQAIYGRYELRTVGGDKANRSVFFAAVSLADSLRHATSKGDEGEENRLIGFSSRLANTPDDPPQVYIGGATTPVSMSFTPNRFPDEETTLLEYGIQFHDKLFARIANEGWSADKTFNIKNLKFVTIPGFTFEVSFGNIYASAKNSGKDGASNFTQPISWNVEKFNNGPAGDNWPVIPDTKAEKDKLAAGETIIRPDAPAPKATAFNAKILGTGVQLAGGKINILIKFDTELDTREYGFGIDVTNKWDTIWSDDKKMVTLSMDNTFPGGADAHVIIFRLKDATGNMIPGPIYLPFTFPRTAAFDSASSSPAVAPAANPVPAPTAFELSIPPVLDNTGVANVKLDDKKAADLLSTNAAIILPATAGAKAFGITLPAASISSTGNGKTLTLSTKAGKLTIPDNMLAGAAGISGKEIGVTIGAGDKAALPANIKTAVGDRPLIQLSLSVDGKQTDWSNPAAPVTVSIPYTPTADELENPENIVVWYIDGSGKATAVPNGRYDVKTGTVTFKTTHFSLYAVTYVQKAFTDLGSVNWAKKQIEVLAAKDILKASGSTFNPSANITRADFLYSLIRALGADAAINGNFDDVSKDSYYYNEIAVAKALGITNGVGGNKFDVGSSITRQDMMAMTNRALSILKKVKQQSSASVLDRFTDKSKIASYAVNSVATIVNEGLIEGSNNAINPTGYTSRAEAAVFLYRIYNKY